MSAIRQSESPDVPVIAWTDEAERNVEVASRNMMEGPAALTIGPNMERLTAQAWLLESGFTCNITDRPPETVIPFGAAAAEVLAGKRLSFPRHGEATSGETLNSPKAEISVLSGMILNDGLIAKARAIGLTSLAFFDSTRARIFKTILNLDEGGRKVNHATLEAYLRDQGMTEHAARQAVEGVIVGPIHEEDFKVGARRIVDDLNQRTLAIAAAEVQRRMSGGKRLGAESVQFCRDFLQRLERLAESDWESPDTEVLEKAAPFPLHVLPEPLRAFVCEVADSIPCPVDYVAVPCLAVASAAIGRSMSLTIKPGWTEEANIWTAIVGDPGTAKTPPLNAALKPLFRIMREEKENHDFLKRQAKERKRELEAERKKHGADLAGMIEEASVVPALRRVLLSDATCEALAPRLSENPRGFLIAFDELAGWINGMNQYKSGGNDREFFLKLWSRSALIVDRKGQEGGIPIYAASPYASVTGGIQPEKLDCIATGKDDGFMDRLLVAFPENVEIRFRRNGVYSGKIWDAAIRKLWGVEFVENDPGEHELLAAKHCLHFTSEGLEQYRELFDRNADATRHPEFSRKMTGPYAKLRTYGARLALILEMLEWAFRPSGAPRDLPSGVGSEAVKSAEKLLVYFASHYQRVMSLAAGAEADNKNARDILKWLESRKDTAGKTRFTYRQVRDNFRRRFKDDEKSLETALDWLARKHFIAEAESKRVPCQPGRSPGTVFELNPFLLSPEARAIRAEFKTI